MNFFRSAYDRLSVVNLSHVLVLALVVKALVSDVSYSTFLLTLPVLGFEAYKLYLKSKKPDPVQLDAEMRKELDNIKAKINAQTMDKNIKQPVPRYF